MTMFVDREIRVAGRRSWLIFPRTFLTGARFQLTIPRYRIERNGARVPEPAGQETRECLAEQDTNDQSNF